MENLNVTENENELRKTFYKNLGWYFSSKEFINEALTSVAQKLIPLGEELKKLNDNLIKADQSSTTLTKALNRLTKWGVIIAAFGVGVAFISLIFDIIKYFDAK